MTFRPFKSGNDSGEPGNEFDRQSNKKLFLFGLVALIIIVVINLITKYL